MSIIKILNGETVESAWQRAEDEFTARTVDAIIAATDLSPEDWKALSESAISDNAGVFAAKLYADVAYEIENRELRK